jgi:hypothetical protein
MLKSPLGLKTIRMAINHSWLLAICYWLLDEPEIS